MASTPEATDSDWLSLRAAVPSFADRWNQVVSGEDYDPQLPYVNVYEFAVHLSKLAVTGDFSGFPALFAALEEAYATAERGNIPSVTNVLTFGLLEDLIYAFEEASLEPRSIEPFLLGERSRAGWQAAYAYTHPAQ